MRTFLLLAIALLTVACGTTPTTTTTSSEPPPDDETTTPPPVKTARALVEPHALDGCPAVSPGYLARPERTAVRIDQQLVRVRIEPQTGALHGTTILAVNPTGVAEELLLSWREGLTPTGMDTLETGAPASCEQGKLPTGHYLRVVFDEPMTVGEPRSLQVSWRLDGGRLPVGDDAAPLDTWVAWPTTFLGSGWYPRPLAPGSIPTTLEVVVPGDEVVLGPGAATEVLPLEGEPTARVHAFESLTVSEARSLPVVVLPAGMAGWHLSLEGGGALTVSADLMLEGRVKQVHELLSSLGARLGPVPHEQLGLAVVPTDGVGVLTHGPGLVIVDQATFESPDGPSVVLDAAARQWLEHDMQLSTAMREAVVRYLLAAASDRPLLALDTLRATYTDAVAALPKRPEPGEGDVAVSELTLLDAMFVPVAYGRLPVALAMLERTVGEAAFASGLTRFLSTAASRETATVSTADDVDALEQALSAEGDAPTALVDATLRSTRLIAVSATCREGRLEVAQRGGEPVVPLTLLASVGDDGQGDGEPDRVSVSFTASSVTVETELCAGEGAPVTFPGQLVESAR